MPVAEDSINSEETVAAWRDRLGICLSVLCLVHCLLTPLVLGLVPVGAALGFWQHGFHQVFLLVVPFVAMLAFVPGWRRHRDSRVWYWGLSGILLLAFGVVAGETLGHGAIDFVSIAIELALTLSGGACLIRAHLLNRHLCACCSSGHAAQHKIHRHVHRGAERDSERGTERDSERDSERDFHDRRAHKHT